MAATVAAATVAAATVVNIIVVSEHNCYFALINYSSVTILLQKYSKGRVYYGKRLVKGACNTGCD